MRMTLLLVLLIFAGSYTETSLARDDTPPSRQTRSATANQGQLFDSLMTRYGVRGEEESASVEVFKARIAELKRALPSNDVIRSARLDVYRCITFLDGPEASLARAEAGLAAWPASRDAMVHMEYLMCKAYALYNLGNRSAYIIPLNEVLQLADADRHAYLRSGALYLRSFYEGDLGHQAQALNTLREVLELDRKRKAPTKALYVEIMIAMLFGDMGFDERAIDLLRGIEKNVLVANDSNLMQMVQERLGQAEERKGDLDAALVKYREGVFLAGTRDAFDTQASLMLRIAHVQVLAGRLGDAKTARDEAERLLIRAKATGAMRPRRGYIDALLALESGDSGLAAQLLPNVISRFRQDDQLGPLANALDLQARVYRKLGQWRLALDARDEQLALRAQLDQRMQREQARVLVTELALSRETAEKQQLLLQTETQQLQLQAAQREQRLRLIAIVLLVLLLGALAGLLLLTRHRLRGARHDVMTDSLTGVASRRHLLDELTRLLTDQRATARPLSVLAIDIDHFKQVNDRFGHAMGDKVLRRVTDACRRALRESDEFGRLGGEEFMAVLRQTSLARAEQVGKHLCEIVATMPMEDVEPGLRVTISVGVAEATANEIRADKLMLRVDAALYEAKRSGRNCTRVAASS